MTTAVSATDAAGSDPDDDYPTYGEVLAADLAHHLATEGANLSVKFQDALREAIRVLA